jgi:hypothetical protein
LAVEDWTRLSQFAFFNGLGRSIVRRRSALLLLASRRSCLDRVAIVAGVLFSIARPSQIGLVLYVACTTNSGTLPSARGAWRVRGVVCAEEINHVALKSNCTKRPSVGLRRLLNSLGLSMNAVKD